MLVIHMQGFIHNLKCIYIYMYIHMCVCVCSCVCMCVYECTSLLVTER